ncbi:secreted RxLR effector peptide protein, putative [Phytophthora infestans T30-4]|uniref:RxLR effector protein n=1 Tax=Phytophthora infestans (strain T30-4) TaxID=403677 RepID=D0NNG1_PHYIT|nr:secreted RxLR effector peptide protein, putative [Phytophthora infestans T30-4]EEY62132.1 secreted RxLR effector peptide protein, putative [Phytophthora infestans T30-4]|eukprot:XP_002899163.1 secreted RxLR effector peptide protein, putative [Phytophthora infestans T30-4]
MRFIYFLLVGSAAIFAASEGAVPTPSKQLKISSADVLRPVDEAPSRRVLRSRDTAEASEDLSDEERGPYSYLYL